LIQLGREHRFEDWYQKVRIRIADHRIDVPREVPFTPGFNQWSANVAGATLFLPVAELTAAYINGLLFTFGEEFGGFAVDDHNFYRAAGLARFAREHGGHLYSNFKDGRVAPLNLIETWVCEFATVELGGILQNLGLMTQALGLGGFPYFAAHPYAWLEALAFRMEQIPVSRIVGAGNVLRRVANAVGLDALIPTAVGFEHNGEILIKPFCPPYYRNMREAVLAFVESKYAEGQGTFRDGGAATAWRDGERVQRGIPSYSDQAIEATIAYCEYIYNRYGRFPVNSGPFRTLLAYQAHHLDLDFYARFYQPAALSETQREHAGNFHEI
jgi:hypothetical protein